MTTWGTSPGRRWCFEYGLPVLRPAARRGIGSTDEHKSVIFHEAKGVESRRGHHRVVRGRSCNQAAQHRIEAPLSAEGIAVAARPLVARGEHQWPTVYEWDSVRVRGVE